MKHHLPVRLSLAMAVVVAGMLLARSMPARGEAGGALSLAGQDLARLARLIQSHLLASDQNLTALKDRMPPLATELEELIGQIQNLRPPRPDDTPPPEPDAPMRHRWRPPMERLTRKDQILIACFEGRLAVLPDVSALNEHCNTLARRRPPQKEEKERVEFEMPDCSARFQLTMEGRIGQEGWNAAVTIVGNQGETAEDAMREGSRFRRVLASRDPEKDYYTFLVWPDSYSAFHQVRTLVWEGDFDAGWAVFRSGESLGFGEGAGTVY